MLISFHFQKICFHLSANVCCHDLAQPEVLNMMRAYEHSLPSRILVKMKEIIIYFGIFKNTIVKIDTSF